MQPIINTKPLFYDYFPHISVMRMKTEFNLGYFEQAEIRTRIQRVISAAYERLLDIHDLRHANVYQEIGEEFNDSFYHELKETVTRRFHSETTWEFLDNLMPVQEIEDDNLNANFQTKMLAVLGYGLPRSLSTCRVNLKDALVALLNFDLDSLSGQELLYLSKTK
jgi:hypothetical protein